MKRYFLLFLFLLFITGLSSFAQKGSKKIVISGLVTDRNQKPVSEAIILIDDVKTNVMTDAKGYYKIRVSPKAVKITAFTLIKGMASAEIGGRTNINLTLNSSVAAQPEKDKDQIKEDETVNVGYGTVRKKDLVSQVGKIDGTNKKFLSYRNVYDMIRGEVPGVRVSGKSIMIQGMTSVSSGTEPLFVVDGIPVSSIDGIVPQNVKSIEVLKGAAASIYGSRGSNGVILITLMGPSGKDK